MGWYTWDWLALALSWVWVLVLGWVLGLYLGLYLGRVYVCVMGLVLGRVDVCVVRVSGGVWVDVGVGSLILLHLGWAGWVLAICILHVPPICLVLVTIPIICNRNEVGVLVIILICPPIVTFVASWVVGSVSRWSFGFSVAC